MLVLSRKRNEGILIRGKDGDIRILLIDVEKGKIRIGIDAPKGYTILREEILSEVKDANRLSLIDDLEKIKGMIGDRCERDQTKG